MVAVLPVDCRQPIWFLASTWDRNGHICTQAVSGFLPFTVIRTHMYTCAFLMQKKAFDRVNHSTQAKKTEMRRGILRNCRHFWYR